MAAGKCDRPGDSGRYSGPSQTAPDVLDQISRVHIGPVHVIEDVHARSLREGVNQERGHVADIRQGLHIISRSHYKKAPRRDLVQKVIDVSPIPFSENDGWAKDRQGAGRIFGGPGAIVALGFRLGLAVSFERGEGAALVYRIGVEPIDGDAASKDDLLDSGMAGGKADLRCAFHVGLVIAGKRAHIVAVFGGEIDERAPGLQADRNRPNQLSLRAAAGSQRGIAPGVGEAGPAEATLWLSASARGAGAARPGGEREAGLRLYAEEGLAVRRRRRKRLVRERAEAPRLARANEERAMDFIVDGLANGRMVRILSVVYAFTRECLALEADTSLGSGRVTRVLDRLIEERGQPESVRSDNGPEFTSRQMPGWAEERKISLVHIQPGRPMQNGHVESFHGRLRDECLNVNWFRTLNDVRWTVDRWCQDYNCERPHSSLAYKTPEEFAASQGYGDVESKERFPHPHSPDYYDDGLYSSPNQKPGNSSYRWMRKTGQVNSRLLAGCLGRRQELIIRLYFGRTATP